MQTYAEGYFADRADHLLKVAAAFDGEGRKIPSHILTQLIQCRASWKRKKNVPAQVKAALQVHDRCAPKKE